MIKSQKGITLVALIITIIVMLILAGVSISLVLDEGGVLNQAQGTEAKQVEGALREAVALANADLMAEFYANTVGYDVSNVAAMGKITAAIERNCSYTVTFEMPKNITENMTEAELEALQGTVRSSDIYYNEANSEKVYVKFDINLDRRYPVITALPSDR